MRKINSEKKIENDKFNLKIGTTNRLNPLVVYIEGRTCISPEEEKESYNRDIYEIKRTLKHSISKNIESCDLFENKFILDFQITESGVAKNKKSALTFQFLLKQNKDNVLKIKDVHDNASEVINNIIKSLEEAIYSHDFAIYKTKK